MRIGTCIYIVSTRILSLNVRYTCMTVSFPQGVGDWVIKPTLTPQLFIALLTRLGIKVITKLPNSEQSYKGKVKTHNYINRQNQSTTGKL